MPENIKSVIRLFADDVKLVGDANDSDVVMQDLESLSNWESDWCMNFNPTKCAVVHIGKNNGRQSYFLGGNELKVVEEEKDLGVVFSESFSWYNHIQESIGKAKRMTSWILRNVLFREVDVLLPVYKSMIRPHLEYCVQVWAPRPRYGNWQSIMELENCQRKFKKLIRGMENLSYEDRLIKLGVTTLLERRSRGDLIELFRNGKARFELASLGDSYYKCLGLIQHRIMICLSVDHLSTGIDYPWKSELHPLSLILKYY